MTSRQKWIIAILVVANLAILSTLGWLVARSSGEEASLEPWPEAGRSTATPLPASGSVVSLPTVFPPPVLSPEACRWEAAQLLVHAGLDGKITMTGDGALRFEVVHLLAPGETVDRAAQWVWPVFDIVLALQMRGCAFIPVEVQISAQDAQMTTYIYARVNPADLAAYGAGTLSEDAFIDRVLYSTSQSPSFPGH